LNRPPPHPFQSFQGALVVVDMNGNHGGACTGWTYVKQSESAFNWKYCKYVVLFSILLKIPEIIFENRRQILNQIFYVRYSVLSLICQV
jgi:hypothetical protein